MNGEPRRISDFCISSSDWARPSVAWNLIDNPTALKADRLIRFKVYRLPKDWHHVLQGEFLCEDDGELDLGKLKAHLQTEGDCEVPRRNASNFALYNADPV